MDDPRGPDRSDEERISDLALDDIHISRLQAERDRPPALTTRQAIAVLQFESTIVYMMWHAIMGGHDVSPQDVLRFERAMLTIERISTEVLK